MQPKHFAFAVVFICLSAQVFAQIQARALQQIELLLQEKQSRTPAQQKMDSRLLQATRERRGQRMVEGVNLAPVNLDVDKNGNLEIDITADVNDALLSKIKSTGGIVIFSSAPFHSIRAKVSLSTIEVIANSREVKFIKPAALAIRVGAKNISDLKASKVPLYIFAKPGQQTNLLERYKRVQQKIMQYLQKSGKSFTGYVDAEGDHAHRADDVRNTFGYAGQGIKIGVLSDSYNSLGGAAADILNGELPGTSNPIGNTTPVTVVQDHSGSDEGRAMLQIVHDIAPKAQLFFATADNGEASFANNILALRNTYHCDIIIDDVFYSSESAFQDGIIAQAVNTITADGALYFSSAGNEGSVEKGTGGYYEGDFNDAGSPTFATSKTGTIHNFGTVSTPINGDIINSTGFEYILNWADPLSTSANDYDLFLVASDGTIKAASTTTQNGTQDPFEFINPLSLASGDRLVVFKASTAQPLAFCINTLRGTLSIATTGQAHGHSCAANAFSVAATPAVSPGPYPGIFASGDEVEYFSSDGPRRVFFNSDGTPVTAGNLLFSTNGGAVRSKPDITAADGVSTTLPASTGLNPFYGTSAAAPHAGAIAALLLSANPSLTASQIRTILASTALDIESPGYDNVSGYGIVQAFQAMQAVNPTPLPNITVSNVITSETGNTNNNGVFDVGEDGKVTVQLSNPSTTDATSVNAVLTTSTPGITITQPTIPFGTIVSSGSATNSATPLTFHINSSAICGTVINFGVTASFNGGNSSNGIPFTINVGSGSQSVTNISSSLGAPSSGSGYTSLTGTQTGRLSRTSPASACGNTKATPSLFSSTGSRVFDSYTFTNTGSYNQCVTVTMNTTNGNNMYVVAYNNNGYIPSSPGSNYLADAGTSSNSQSLSFTSAAGQSFTVVVHELNAGSALGAAYTLSVSSNTCNTLSILPVTWLSFTATEKNKQSLLQWKVANELNVDHYEVEYSMDGIHFSEIYALPVKISLSGENNYEQVHPYPVGGLNYYMIKQVDKNSHFSYSKIASVRINSANVVTVTPNPASDHISIQTGTIINRIQLYNSIGQLLFNAAPAKNNYTLSLSNYAAGEYFLRIEAGNKIFNEKIVKQ